MIMVFVWLVVGLLGIQLLLLLSLTSWKYKTIKHEQKISALQNSLKPQFIEYIEGKRSSEPDLPKSKKMQVAVMECMLDEFHTTVNGKLEKEKLNDLAEKYLASHYRYILKNGKWAERINALYFIEDFNLFSLREDTYRHFVKLKKKDEEFRQCLRTCTTLQDERMITVIFENNSLSVGLLKEMLARLNDDLLRKTLVMGQEREKIADNVLFAVIAFSGEHKNEIFFPVVEKRLRDERKEVRLKAMNSLCNYKKISDPSILPAFFDSVHWEERMYAAKLVGACKLTKYTRILVNLLSDSEWWVRFAAAENITEFPEGETLLKQVTFWDEDAYSRDIAKHVLTRKGGETYD
ncbi:HEAT repeat domain-containing protein [Planococcus sp. N028]|uniref:HEAT repeat domain-containing protein n=1 Tax=Planococcus shixiaomingii TaxID=3058393 RepID=A0ABT8N3Y5_9BACL|nr:HEAT repeat domain-containing protein [Planococcus sp. N028]MDN7242453.1 HEAT repeat domain-containing protein [Planococcus sp. N028]